MTLHEKHIARKPFKIEILLKVTRWSKSELARELGISPQAMEQFYNTWARTLGIQKKHTKAFNECFETNYSYKELFSLENK